MESPLLFSVQSPTAFQELPREREKEGERERGGFENGRWGFASSPLTVFRIWKRDFFFFSFILKERSE